MRWLVEVTSLGKAEKDSLYVDADSWQKALQVARSLRGESEPLSGFSIELLEEGCRAVDPVSRVSYEVHRAPEDGRPSVPRPSTPPAKSAAGEVGSVSVPPRPSQGGPATRGAAPAQSTAPSPPHAVAPSPPHAAPAAPTQASAPPTAQPVAPSPPQPVAPSPPQAVAPAAAQPVAPAAAPPQGIAPSPAAAAAAAPAIPSRPESPRPRSQAPSAPRPAISPSATMMIGSPAPPSVTPQRVVEPAPQPQRDANVAILPSQIVFRREQDATEALPLTYREYVYVVPPGSTETAAGTLVHSQFDLVRASLDRMPAGKLVNLAVFDAIFQGKPTVLPLATLTWKDWRGAALVSFPRQPGRAPVPIPTAPIALPSSAPPGAPAENAHPSRPPPAPVPSPAVGPPVIAPPVIALPAGAPVIAPPVAASPLAPAQAPVPPVLAPSVAAQASPPWGPPVAAPAPVAAQASPPWGPPVAAPAPVAAPPPMFIQQGVSPFGPSPGLPFAPSPFAQPIAPPDLQGLPPSQPAGRVHGEDLIADLFESMHDLHFARDTIDGGDFCLALAMEKFAAAAGVILLYDINHREFVVTNTRGAGAEVLLLRRFPEGDGLLAAATRKRQAVVIANAEQSEAATNERYVAIGGVRSLIVAPVMQSGRFLGAIELVNPTDGEPFTESDGNAVTYIAEQFAGFVAERGIVTDPERIGGRR